MDLWHFGRNPFDMPVHNLYIPVKTTLMMKPKFVKGEDELGWRLIDRHDKTKTTPRIDPIAPLNPLKGVPLSPNLYKEKIDTIVKDTHEYTPTFFKRRGISKVKPVI
jgi:hypothetical protein